MCLFHTEDCELESIYIGEKYSHLRLKCFFLGGVSLREKIRLGADS